LNSYCKNENLES